MTGINHEIMLMTMDKCALVVFAVCVIDLYSKRSFATFSCLKDDENSFSLLLHHDDDNRRRFISLLMEFSS